MEWHDLVSGQQIMTQIEIIRHTFPSSRNDGKSQIARVRLTDSFSIATFPMSWQVLQDYFPNLKRSSWKHEAENDPSKKIPVLVEGAGHNFGRCIPPRDEGRMEETKYQTI